MEKDTVEKLYCVSCRKRLPADILLREGRVRLLVICPHCKERNIIEKSPGR